MMIESSANGSVSGSESRIVIGCSHDSNCAARIRYMKTSDSTNASRKFCAARASSRDRPANRVAVPGPISSDSAARRHRRHRRRLRDARQQAGKDRDLALAVEAVDFGRRRARREARHVVERHAAERASTAPSAARSPRRVWRSALDGAGRAPRTARPLRCTSSPDLRRPAAAAPRRRPRSARRGPPPSTDRDSPRAPACRR